MTHLLTLIIGAVATIHVAWGLRIWVPIKDEAQLARTVVGAKGVTRMPGTIPCFLVVAALFVVIAALWMAEVSIARIVLWAALSVFVGRGALAYTKMWRQMTPEEPFNTYDQRYYGPLCILLGVGILIVLLGG